MEGLEIKLDGDGAWPDLIDKPVLDCRVDGIAALADGTVVGRPSVAIRVNLPDGSVVLAQTTLRLLVAAVDAICARYGRPA